MKHPNIFNLCFNVLFLNVNINNYTMCFIIILYKDDYILVSIDKTIIVTVYTS